MAADRTQDLKSRLQTLSAEQLTGLRQIYSYRLAQITVNSMGCLNLFLGLITVWSAVGISGPLPVKIIQASLGFATVVVSLWSIGAPRPLGVLVWCGLLGLLGVWNTFIAVTGSHLNFLILLLGLLQVWVAIRMYQLFQKNPPPATAHGETLRVYDELRGVMWQLKTKEDSDPDAIRFQFRRRWWHGFLLPDRIALVLPKGVGLLVIPKDKATFNFAEKHSFGGARQMMGNLNLDGVELKQAIIPRTTYERCQQWKDTASA